MYAFDPCAPRNSTFILPADLLGNAALQPPGHANLRIIFIKFTVGELICSISCQLQNQACMSSQQESVYFSLSCMQQGKEMLERIADWKCPSCFALFLATKCGAGSD
eukprot:scaffold300097_cov13-Tisochrysis_lutea.AAC.1